MSKLSSCHASLLESYLSVKLAICQSYLFVMLATCHSYMSKQLAHLVPVLRKFLVKLPLIIGWVIYLSGYLSVRLSARAFCRREVHPATHAHFPDPGGSTDPAVHQPTSDPILHNSALPRRREAHPATHVHLPGSSSSTDPAACQPATKTKQKKQEPSAVHSATYAHFPSLGGSTDPAVHQPLSQFSVPLHVAMVSVNPPIDTNHVQITKRNQPARGPNVASKVRRSRGAEVFKIYKL